MTQTQIREQIAAATVDLLRSYAAAYDCGHEQLYKAAEQLFIDHALIAVKGIQQTMWYKQEAERIENIR